MGKDIHWYPGHMKKAEIQVSEKLKIVDCVIELLDSRIPFSSRNNSLYNLTKDKKRLVVLTKADLADPKISELWVSFFKEMGFDCIFADLNNPNDIKNIIHKATLLGKDKAQKYIDKGMKPQPIRAMIIGIPNVGKSTLINKISKRKAASVMNKPGHTKAQQWIKVNNDFELLDTPGILQSSYEDENKAINLALVGSINENILPNDDLANYLLNYLKDNYPNLLMQRYDLNDLSDNNLILKGIAKRRGFLKANNEDTDKAITLLLNEFKNGLIGRVSLEKEVKCL